MNEIDYHTDVSINEFLSTFGNDVTIDNYKALVSVYLDAKFTPKQYTKEELENRRINKNSKRNGILIWIL